jgi:hypothetical protein
LNQNAEENLNEIIGRLERSSQKSLRRLAWETGFKNMSTNCHKTPEIKP